MQGRGKPTSRCRILMLSLVYLYCLLLWHGASAASTAANQFPSLEDSADMVRLSRLVYHFNHEDKDYCKTYTNDDHGYSCEWYEHYAWVGTKVMLATNSRKGLIVVAFAGTDDIRSSLEDVNLAMTSFGNNGTVALSDPGIQIHAGFNNAVFSHGIWEDIYTRVRDLLQEHPSYKIWTTGHSLGAANAVLTATALAIEGYSAVSVTVGCPRIGNSMWRDYFDSTNSLEDRLSIWRLVLAWDLIPRLPDFHFYHIGHTIQLWSEKHGSAKYAPDTVEGTPAMVFLLVGCFSLFCFCLIHPFLTHRGPFVAIDRWIFLAYYQHYGDEAKGYAGVDASWAIKPHVMPSAMTYHFIWHYVSAIEEVEDQGLWVTDFKTIGYEMDAMDS